MLKAVIIDDEPKAIQGLSWELGNFSDEIEVIADTNPPQRYALLGVRSCELKAIEIQDKVFSSGPQADDDYLSRREASLIIAVNCGQAGATCFCVSMDSGPRAEAGYDLSLTECIINDASVFLAETGSPAGVDILDNVPHEVATEEIMQLARDATSSATRQMGRTMDTQGIKELLQSPA